MAVGLGSALALGLDELAFVDHFVVDSTPYVFGDDRYGFIEWRRELAAALGVDPVGVRVVGSACVGFSLNPDKEFHPFGPGSDIDVAVVSARHYEAAWQELVKRSKELHKLPRRVARSIRQHAARDVFRGCIATDRILEVLPFAAEWIGATTAARHDSRIAPYPVNFRLYRDFESLRSYQESSVAKAMQEILVAGP